MHPEHKYGEGFNNRNIIKCVRARNGLGSVELLRFDMVILRILDQGEISHNLSTHIAILVKENIFIIFPLG